MHRAPLLSSSSLRSPSRKQAGRGSVGVALLVAVVGAYFGYRSCRQPDLGEKLTFGKGEVYYKDGATRQEAQGLGDFLKVVGYFAGPNRASVLLTKQADHYVLSFVVKKGVEKNEEAVASLREIGAMISDEVFGGAVVEIRLVDDELKLKRALEPVDASDPNLWQTPPLLVGFELEPARKSALYQRFEPQIRAVVEDATREMGIDCGWQVFGSLRSIMARRYVQPEASFMLVFRGVPRSMLVPCLEGAANKPDAALQVTENGDFTALREGETELLLRWLDADSFIVEVGDESGPVLDQQRLGARVSAQVGLDDHAQLAAKAKAVDPAAVAWLAWAPRPPSSGAQPPAGVGARVSVLLDTGLRLDAEMRLLDNTQAQSFARWLAHLVDGLGDVPSLTKVRSLLAVEIKGRDILATMNLDEAQLGDLAATVAADDKLHQLLSQP